MNSDHKSLRDFPVVVEFPVLWGDQDAFGHVNNLVYMRWAETARVEYLVRIGLWAKLPPEGVAPILAAIACSYRKPVQYPDTVRVGARVTKVGNSSIKMDHLIVSRALDTVVAEVESTLVVLDYRQMKPVAVPEEVRKAVERLESARHDR